MVRTCRPLALLVPLAACTAHERPQEPTSACAPGMVLIDGEAPGPLSVAKFCMDITEVTTASYGACVHAGVCTPAIVGVGVGCNLTHAERADHPINCTTWEQAQTYCGWVGKRLPDDEEWIFAAHHGTPAAPYPWGHQAPDATRACWDRKDAGTCPVGSIPGGANQAGVLDLVGNVAEWTRGWGDRGKASPGGRGRLRGGSFEDSAYRQPIDERFADSARDEPTEAARLASGLRCVVSPHTPVPAIEATTWTPHVTAPSGLPPALATTPAMPRPTRPLANLAVLHRSADEQPVWWSIGDTRVGLPPAVAHQIGLTRHLQRDTVPEALKEFEPLRWLGDAVLMRGGSTYDYKLIAVDPPGLKLRWQNSLGSNGRTFEQVVTPRVFIAAFTSDVDLLIAYALDSGREVWRTSGGDATGWSNIKRLWADGERGFIVSDHGLTAFDANTGATQWTDVPLAQDCGVATAPGAVVVEDPAGYRVLDTDTGTLVRTVGKPGGCGWGSTTWEGSLPTGVIADGRLFAFEPRVRRDDDDGTATLRAYDLTTGADLWRRTRVATHPLLADQDAVYLGRADHETLIAADAASGATRAEISIGAGYEVSVEPAGGEAGPVLVVRAHGTGTWILGRAEQPAAPESYVIRGRLVPDEFLQRKRVANVPVRVGQRIVRTDADGRFEARGRTVGAVAIALGTTRGPDQPGGSRVTFTATYVMLDGAGAPKGREREYTAGDIVLSEWAMY